MKRAVALVVLVFLAVFLVVVAPLGATPSYAGELCDEAQGSVPLVEDTFRPGCGQAALLVTLLAGSGAGGQAMSICMATVNGYRVGTGLVCFGDTTATEAVWWLQDRVADGVRAIEDQLAAIGDLIVWLVSGGPIHDVAPCVWGASSYPPVAGELPVNTVNMIYPCEYWH